MTGWSFPPRGGRGQRPPRSRRGRHDRGWSRETWAGRIPGLGSPDIRPPRAGSGVPRQKQWIGAATAPASGPAAAGCGCGRHLVSATAPSRPRRCRGARWRGDDGGRPSGAAWRAPMLVLLPEDRAGLPTTRPGLRALLPAAGGVTRVGRWAQRPRRSDGTRGSCRDWTASPRTRLSATASR